MKTTEKTGVLALSLAIMVLSALPAAAQSLDRTYGAWNVFTMTQNGQKVCYMASYPRSQKGNYNKRGEPYVLVTHRGPSIDEVSVSSGYPYKVDSDVTVNIDGKVYKLFTKDDLAWAPDQSSDAKLVKSMKKGMNMEVRGNSRLGTYSKDKYSLSGFTKAHKRMKQLCK